MKTKWVKSFLIPLVVIAGVVVVMPILFAEYIKVADKLNPPFEKQFPVTVDPANRMITEDARIETYLESHDFSLEALALLSTKKLGESLSALALAISELVGKESLALASGEKIVTVQAGLRKEEVASTFARALRWTEGQKREFLTARSGEALPLAEGSFSPGVYVVKRGATAREVQNIVNSRFAGSVLARYGTSTAKIVPLNVALTVASLIERETIGTDDMRIVSGIIWNRIFAEMNLQLDATLQYVKASQKKNGIWWPQVGTQDKFIKSPYNTYMHGGLPPTPIASPSVAAIIAALNPVKTDCIFYFHDDDGDLHCTATYKEHVALLKQFYGRGR